MTVPDLDTLVGQAAALLDEVAIGFVEGHRADPLVAKKGNDFATHMDLAIEKQVAETLGALTGIGVHGEEFGHADLDAPWVWVLDPIDGTFNYAAGSPMAAILLALLHEGDPVAGLTWMPFTEQRYVAMAGGPLVCNGVELPVLQPCALADAMVGVGTLNVDVLGRLEMFEKITRVSSKVRMHGSTGIDLAFVASGILGAAVSFGGRVWDHAAGVALVRSAGGIVSDVAGQPWTPQSRSIVAAAPGAHEEIIAILAATAAGSGRR